MNYYYYYYLQTDVICLVTLAVVLRHSKAFGNSVSATQRILGQLILSTMVCTFADMAASLLRGSMIPGARFAIHLSNMVYFQSLTMCSWIWCGYVLQKTGTKYSTLGRWLLQLPLIFITILVVTNPFAEFLFSVNSENLYVRGSGVMMHWVCTWFYFIFATVHSLVKLTKETSRIRRQMLFPLLGFIIAPFIAALLQMFFYGLSTTQSGIAISVLMICMSDQSNQISEDELTGINNRKELTAYVERVIGRAEKRPMLLIMIDINRFKSINDTYGHIAGDQALIAAAEALRNVCESAQIPLFLCRYGGDEFVLSGEAHPNLDLTLVRQSIQHELDVVRINNQFPFELEASIGMSTGLWESLEDFDHHLRLADESMYDDKKRLKQQAK